MKLKEQVTNLELSKKLKELGVEQKSLYCWNEEHKQINSGKIGWEKETKLEDSNQVANFFACISAFTVAELGEDIPSEFLNLIKKDEVGRLRWNIKEYICYENTEANSRAKMLIYLIENDLIKVL